MVIEKEVAEAEAAADVEAALDEAHARRACEAGGALAAGTEAADGGAPVTLRRRAATRSCCASSYSS